MSKFYGFQFADGINTTTGGSNGSKLQTAGMLYAFPSRQARDQWVAEGCDYRNGHTPFRRKVTTRDLPTGWNPCDAWMMEDDGECYPLSI